MNKKNMLVFSLLVLVFGNLLFASAISITGVSTSPSQVAPGDTFQVSLKIENIFSYDVFNVNTKLNLDGIPFAPYKSSSEKTVDEISEGDDKNFNFEIIVLPEATSGIYKIPIKISYEDAQGNESSRNGTIGVTVNSKPELKVSLSSQKLIKGMNGNISLRIVNSGLSDVKFVYLGMDDFGGIKVTSEREQYIGEISSGDSELVDYVVSISTGAQSAVNIPITLKFKDSINQDYTLSGNILLNVYSVERAKSMGLIASPNYFLYGIVIMLISGYVIYRIIKRRKVK